MTRIQEHSSRVKTFQGWGRLTVVSEIESFVALIRVAARPPDSLWLKVEGPLGVDVLIGCFAGDSALLYSPWEDVVYEGSIQRFQDLQILPFPIYSDDLLQSVLGLPLPADAMKNSFVTLSPDARQYIMTLGSQTRLRVEPKGPDIAKWEEMDHTGENLWTWSGKIFRKQRKTWLPRLIRFEQVNPKQRITLFYEKVKINRRLKKQWSHIRIPEGVPRFEF